MSSASYSPSSRSAPAEYAPVSESNDELDELPLGKLISLLRKVLPGSNVLSDLERLRPERNHCAHRALVLCFISDVSDVISLEKEFRRLCKHPTACVVELRGV